MISAVAVMLWHTIAHLELMLPDWFNAIIGWVPAVPVFLSISGYLIWNSIDRSPSYLSYLKKRFIRIYPELWVAVIIEIVVLIFLYGTGGSILSLLLFIIGQATILQFWTPGSLRGYGCGTPNGALGTISTIIQFYIIAWALKKCLKGKKWYVWVLVWIGSVLISVLGHKLLEHSPDVLLKLYDVSIFRFLWLFLGGCFVSEYFKILIPWLKKLWPVFIIASVVWSYLHFDINAGYTVVYSILCFAGLLGFAYAFPRLKIKTDISYEIYLLHMTAVNALIQAGMRGNIVSLFVVVISTCIVGWLLWVTVGKKSSLVKAKV